MDWPPIQEGAAAFSDYPRQPEAARVSTLADIPGRVAAVALPGTSNQLDPIFTLL